MSDTEYGRIPPLTLGLRLKMAKDWSGYDREVMATELGVSAATISRWMNDDGATPNRGYITAWAAFTRCDFQWLLTGEQPPDGGPAEVIEPTAETEIDLKRGAGLRRSPGPRRQG